MSKILIQIPCLNEETVLKNTLNQIRENTKNIDNIEILVIDDGSNDNTVKVAKENNVDHIICHPSNIGLGFAFQSGLNFAKKNDFEYLINVDADNQYKSEYISSLIENIKDKKLDIVIGSRDFNKISHFSNLKKKLQKFGSWVVKVISNENISDASSGFRIYSKNAINKINCTSRFSYTMDTIIQAKDKNLNIGEIRISTNKPTRSSRLFKSNIEFIFNQAKIILNCFAIYKPFIFFFYLSLLPMITGSILFIRFFLQYIFGDGSGHIQSIVFGSTSLILGFILVALGIIGELIKHNRKILEKINEK